MAFFNLTHVGYQNVFNELKKDETTAAAAGSSSRQSGTYSYKAPMISNLKYQDLKTKHVRAPNGNLYYQFNLLIDLYNKNSKNIHRASRIVQETIDVLSRDRWVFHTFKSSLLCLKYFI